MIKKFITLIICLVVIKACSGAQVARMSLDSEELQREAEFQKELAIESNFRYTNRLHSVGYQILNNSAELCDKQTMKLGVVFGSLNLYDFNYVNAAKNVLNLSEQLKIVSIAKGSAAEKNGLAVDDIILSINFQNVPTEKRDFDNFFKNLDKLLKQQEYVTIDLQRGANESAEYLTIDFKLDQVCDYPVLLGQSDSVNAYADGTNIVIEKGMMRFAESDKELGLVVAHELGHNVMKHIDKKRGNAIAGSFLDIIAAGYGYNTYGAFGDAAAQAYSQDFEAEADYVGLYYLHNAGFDVAGSSLFWRRMAAEYPGSISSNHTSSHPGTSERFLAIQKIEQEIKNGGDPQFLVME